MRTYIYRQYSLNVLRGVSHRSQVDEVPVEHLLVLNALVDLTLRLVLLDRLDQVRVLVEHFLDLRRVGRRSHAALREHHRHLRV